MFRKFYILTIYQGNAPRLMILYIAMTCLWHIDIIGRNKI